MTTFNTGIEYLAGIQVCVHHMHSNTSQPLHPELVRFRLIENRIFTELATSFYVLLLRRSGLHEPVGGLS